MQTDAYRLWSSRIVTFAMTALTTASAAYWGLKLSAPGKPADIPVVAEAWAPPVGPKVLARALGGGLATVSAVSGVAPPPAISRYALVGVIAAPSQGGAALIAIDGKEAKPVRVGSLVDNGLVLQSVTGRRAVLSSGVEAATVTLELPPLVN